MHEPTAHDEALRSLGARLRYVRETRGYTLAQCAERSRIPVQRLRSYEEEKAEPSLPEIEAIAYALNVSVQALVGEAPLLLHTTKPENLAQWVKLRHQIIGALLSKARSERKATLKEVAQATGLKPAQLRRIESGQPVSLSVLQKLMAYYGLTLEQLLDLGVGHIGEAQLHTWQCEQLARLEPELRKFVTQPDAAPYLEVARRLSELPAGTLGAFVQALAHLDALALVQSSSAER